MKMQKLRRMFEQERRRFAKFYPKCAIATLELVPFERNAFRSFARCWIDDTRLDLQFHPLALVHLDEHHFRALLRHEFAHCCEPDFNEREVDALAELIGGELIYYDADDIQTTLGGIRPRPSHLHKRSG